MSDREPARTPVRDEPDWSGLVDAVRLWRSSERTANRRLDPRRFFPWLVVRGRATSSDRPAAAAAALVALAPRRAAVPPPAEHWAAIRELVLGEGKLTEPFDVVMAFGCGWHREVVSGDRGWDGRWEPAVAAFLGEVRSVVIASVRLLRDQLPWSDAGRRDIEEYPAPFTMSLLGACDCDHHVRGCGGACGRRCCYPDHDLTKWDPRICHLRPFVEQAVRGSARDTIRGGEFAESMLYRQLEAEGRILRRRVEFCRCSSCDRLYEGNRCPEASCGAPTTPATVRVARANWLVRAEHEGGAHREEQRWICGNRACATLYPITLRLGQRQEAGACPACGWEPDEKPPGSVTVWVRVHGELGLVDGSQGRFGS